MKREVKTRFAPSPTGFVHIGGLRTAIFNYLFARYYEGKFIIRIEDTDTERHFQGAVTDVINYLFWLGIKPSNIESFSDENLKFFRQSFRAGWQNNKYLGHENNHYFCTAIKLVYQKKAYFCFCQKQAENCLCRENFFSTPFNLKKLNVGVFSKKFSIKIHVLDEKEISWNDLVRGRVTFLTTSIEDFIIIKSNFLPTYNFANVIDDLEDEITHVFRGEEHITNTSKQILIYNYLEKEPPFYGHLNILVNSFFSDERYAKLSKRTLSKGEFSFFTSFYKNFQNQTTPIFESCFREALINFLVFSGWTFIDPEKRIFPLTELEKLFNGKKLSKAPIVCEVQKFFWLLIILLKKNWKLISQELIEQIKLEKKNDNTDNYKILSSFFKSWQRIIIDEIIDIFSHKKDIGKKVEILSSLLKKIYLQVYLSKEETVKNTKLIKFFEEKLLFFFKKNESNFLFSGDTVLEEVVNLAKDSLVLYQQQKQNRSSLVAIFKQILSRLFTSFYKTKTNKPNNIIYFFLRCFLTNFYHNDRQRWMPPINEIINFLPEDIFVLRCKSLKTFLNIMFAFHKKRFLNLKEISVFHESIKKQIFNSLKSVCDPYFFTFFHEKEQVEVFFEYENYLRKKKTFSFMNKYFFPIICSGDLRQKIFTSHCFSLKKKFNLRIKITSLLSSFEELTTICQRTFLKSVFSFLKGKRTKLPLKKHPQDINGKKKNYLLVTEKILFFYQKLFTQNMFSTLKPILFLNKKIFRGLFKEKTWYGNEVRLKNTVGKITYLFADIFPFPEETFFEKKLFLIYFPQEVLFPFSFRIICDRSKKNYKVIFYCPDQIMSKNKKTSNFYFLSCSYDVEKINT